MKTQTIVKLSVDQLSFNKFTIQVLVSENILTLMNNSLHSMFRHVFNAMIFFVCLMGCSVYLKVFNLFTQQI